MWCLGQGCVRFNWWIMDHSEHFSSPTPEHIQLILTDTSFRESLLDSFPPEERLQSGNPSEWKRTQSSPALLTPCLSNGLHLKSPISPHDSLAGCLLLMCFRYFSFKFSCLSEVALQNLSLGLPYYSFTVNLPEHLFPCLGTFYNTGTKRELGHNFTYAPPCTSLMGKFHVRYYNFSRLNFFFIYYYYYLFFRIVQ